jgi:hypothetical protein
MDIQMVSGLGIIHTPYVAIAEHDCLYNKEHFEFRPPDKEHFWYNINCWLVQHHSPTRPEYDGMYSFVKDRLAQSMLIVWTDRLREAMGWKLKITSDPAWAGRYKYARIAEPGTGIPHKMEQVARARNSPDRLWQALRVYVKRFLPRTFETEHPTLDVRHGQNFTGQRRGTRRTWDLPPWGQFKEVLNNGTNRTTITN